VLLRSGHDNSVQGGVVRTNIRSSSYTIEASYSVEQADVTFIGEEKLLKEFDVLNGVKADSSLIVKLPGAKDEDLENRLSPALRKAIFTKGVEVFVLDPSLSGKVF